MKKLHFAKSVVVAVLMFVFGMSSTPLMAAEPEYDPINTLLALNMAVVSVKTVVTTQDRIVLDQEYRNIINNLSLGDIEDDSEIVSLYNELLDVITANTLRDEETKRFNEKYDRQQKNAIVSALSNIRPYGGNTWSFLGSLLTQGVSAYFGYRDQKNQLHQELDDNLWQLKKEAIQDFNDLQKQLLSASWGLLRKYKLPDRITQEDLDSLEFALSESDKGNAAEMFSMLKPQFQSYPPFWYYYGEAAYRSGDKKTALKCFDEFDKAWRHVLRRDPYKVQIAKYRIAINPDLPRERIAELLSDVKGNISSKDWLDNLFYGAMAWAIDEKDKGMKAVKSNVLFKVDTIISPVILKSMEKGELDLAALPAEIRAAVEGVMPRSEELKDAGYSQSLPLSSQNPIVNSFEKIRIGEIATLTGDFAEYGIAEVEAVKIAVSEINRKGGIVIQGQRHAIDIFMYDCRTRNAGMFDAALSLVEKDKVVAVIGPSGSGLCITAAPIFNAGQVPHLGTLPTNPLVTVDERGKVRPYNFRMCFLDPYQGNLIAAFAVKDLHAKKAAVLYDVSSDYSNGIRDFFNKAFTGYGGIIVANERHRNEDVDFQAQISEIIRSKPDVLVLPTMGKCTPLAILQARRMGFNGPIVGGDGYGDFFWEIAGDSMKNTFWVSHVDSEDPYFAEFLENYRKTTGHECEQFMNAIMAYDCVYWLKDAIERANSTNPQRVRDALEQTRNLKLLHCTLTMDEFHNPRNKEGTMLEAKDEKAVFFKRVMP